MLADPVDREWWTTLDWSIYRLKVGYYTLTDVNRATRWFHHGDL
jgi:hypothetical protein